MLNHAYYKNQQTKRDTYNNINEIETCPNVLIHFIV